MNLETATVEQPDVKVMSILQQQDIEATQRKLDDRDRRIEQKAQRSAKHDADHQSRRKAQANFEKTLAAIYDAAAKSKTLPAVSLREIIGGAQSLVKHKIPSVENSDLVQNARLDAKQVTPELRSLYEGIVLGGELTHVIADKSTHDRAIIVSYDHHLIEQIKDVIKAFNPNRAFNSATAPVIESCSDMFAPNGRGGMGKSGRMLVIRNFEYLNADKVRGINDFPCRTTAPVYQEIVRQLVDARKLQQHNKKKRPQMVCAVK